MAAEGKSRRNKPPRAALLFELENLGFGGRKVVFDVLKSLLADKDIALSPALYSRCCVDASIERGLGRLFNVVDRKRLTAERLVPDVMSAVRLSHLNGNPSPDPVLAALLKRLAAGGITVGAVSDLDTETAETLGAALDLAEGTLQVLASAAGERRTHDPKSWAAVGRGLKATLPSCVAIVTSAAACLAALSAGMRCVVAADAFTSFQDFGGADAVFDSWNDETVAAVDSMLATR